MKFLDSDIWNMTTHIEYPSSEWAVLIWIRESLDSIDELLIKIISALIKKGLTNA